MLVPPAFPGKPMAPHLLHIGRNFVIYLTTVKDVKARTWQSLIHNWTFPLAYLVSLVIIYLL